MSSPFQSQLRNPPNPSYFSPPQYNYPPFSLPTPSETYPTACQDPDQELFAQITTTTRRKTQTPLSLNIQAVLSAGAFLLQNLVEVASPDGRTTPVSLICIGSADPAVGKSSILKYYMSPVDDYLKAYNKQQKQQDAKYQFEEKVWRKTEQRYINRLTKALERKASAEKTSDSGRKKTTKKDPLSAETIRALLEEHQEKKPTPPPALPMAYLSDITSAAIPKFIKTHNLQSCAIISSEAQEFLKSDIKNNSYIMNKGFSGERVSRHLATRGDESYDIPITTLLFGQPAVIEKAFGGENNLLQGSGTISRCLFTSPISNVGYRDYSNASTNPGPQIQGADSQVLEAYSSLVKQWSDKNIRRTMTGEPKITLVLDTAANQYLQCYEQEVEFQKRPGGRYVEHPEHASRLGENGLRAAGIIHCLNNGLEGKISLATLIIAINIVNCFSTEYQRIFRVVSQAERDAATLHQHLQVKRSEYQRYFPKRILTANGPLRPVARLDAALLELARRGGISINPIASYNHRGQATKPLMIIDLYPHLPVDQPCLDRAVYEARAMMFI